jgi:nitroimidazol reductase NimA-like FMN-containing flavoprotein (pyridoxamine 5'-phosphate oxidase superfamily)
MSQQENHKDELLGRVLDKALYCHLACSYQDEPYLIPLAYGYDGEFVYIHTSKTGKKADIMKNNPRVCLGFEIDVRLQKDPDQACEWAFEYQSVIASGVIEEIVDPDKKSAGLSVIMDHYSNKTWEFPSKHLAKTKVWRIRILEISGKDSSE